jgi:hypothetical protein
VRFDPVPPQLPFDVVSYDELGGVLVGSELARCSVDIEARFELPHSGVVSYKVCVERTHTGEAASDRPGVKAATCGDLGCGAGPVAGKDADDPSGGFAEVTPGKRSMPERPGREQPVTTNHIGSSNVTTSCVATGGVCCV